MLEGKPRHIPAPLEDADKKQADRIVAAKYPSHVWHVDLTTVPTGLGYWCSWLPFALPQSWPFAWWVVVAVDHFSRRVMGATTFENQPNCQAVCGFLGRAIAKANRDSPRPRAGEGQGVRVPEHIVCDRGMQFDCNQFRRWCKRKGIKHPRYGAIGQHGSIAVVERFILTLKGLLACLVLVPFRRVAFRRELTAIAEWYNESRPHTWLDGKTPNEVYFGRFPTSRRPRFEPRSRWPRGLPCAKPWALVRGSPGARVALEVSFYKGKKHLPIVKLCRAA